MTRADRKGMDRAEALAAELQHRTRNLMAVVQALANETALVSGSIEQFSAKFSARLACLARAQELLARLDAGKEASFSDFVEAELKATGAPIGDRVSFEGPPGLRLRSGAIQPLAIALHELAANAVQHGALSQPGGRLSVGWRHGPVADDGRGSFRVEWVERGVSLHAAEAMQVGLGRSMIEQALPFQVGANVSYDLTPDGVRCVIVLPTADGPA